MHDLRVCVCVCLCALGLGRCESAIIQYVSTGGKEFRANVMCIYTRHSVLLSIKHGTATNKTSERINDRAMRPNINRHNAN